MLNRGRSSWLAVLVLATLLALGSPGPAAAQFGPTSGVVAEALEGVPASAPELLTDTIDTDATFASAASSRGFCPVIAPCVFTCGSFPCLFGASAASAVADLPTGTLRAFAQSSSGHLFNSPADLPGGGLEVPLDAHGDARMFDVITLSVPAGAPGTTFPFTLAFNFAGSVASGEPASGTVLGNASAVAVVQMCEEQLVVTEGGTLPGCTNPLTWVRQFVANQLGTFDGAFAIGSPPPAKISDASSHSFNISDALTALVGTGATPRTVRFHISAEIAALTDAPNGFPTGTIGPGLPLPGPNEVANLDHTFTAEVVIDPALSATSDSGVFPIRTPVSADTTPPTTTATPSPAPNASGWNKSNVTVALAATDNAGGSGVKEIHWGLSGVQGGSGVIAGSAGSVTITGEGATTLTYFAVDNAGNVEASKTQTVRLDKTPPVISGLPAAGCSIWPPNHSLVTVGTVTAADALSGLASGSPTVAATGNESATAGAAANTTGDIVIDGTTVRLRAERSGGGGNRVYTVTASATDIAGNVATMQATCTVPHDQRN
jgi:hypothetical protein